MKIVEQIQPDGENILDISPIVVHDVEVFRLDIARLLSYSRKKKNIKVRLQIKDEEHD